jgi:hypothetical protein
VKNKKSNKNDTSRLCTVIFCGPLLIPAGSRTGVRQANHALGKGDHHK